jgi:glycosyltransferase involved in cell wall biosynthesis
MPNDLRSILFLSPASGLTGAERCLLELVTRLDPDRFRPTVLSPAAGPLMDRLEQAGVDVRVVPLPDVLRRAGGAGLWPALLGMAAAPVAMRRPLREIAAIARETRAAIIHSNGTKMHLMAALLKPIVPDVDIVWHLHQFANGHRASRWIRRLYGGRPDRFIANSASVARDLGKKYEARTRVVLNGIDPNEFSPEGPRALDLGGLTVGLVGILTPFKGQRLFLRAAAEVARLRPDIRFAVAGGEMYETEQGTGYAESLRRLAADLDIAGKVRFEPFREDVAAVTRSLDIVTHCSTDPEPFGRVVIEGMSCGRPVIAANAGGVPEIVTHGVDGLLYPMGDAAALRDAILRLADDADLRRRLGAAGRATVLQRFTVDRYAREIQNVYAEL